MLRFSSSVPLIRHRKNKAFNLAMMTVIIVSLTCSDRFAKTELRKGETGTTLCEVRVGIDHLQYFCHSAWTKKYIRFIRHTILLHDSPIFLSQCRHARLVPMQKKNSVDFPSTLNLSSFYSLYTARNEERYSKRSFFGEKEE